MSPWHINHESSKEGHTYVRPLGATELWIYWESQFCGTSDILHHVIVEAVRQPHSGAFAPESVQGAWIRMKRRFPLLGAHLREDDDRQNAHFVVNDVELGRLAADEVQCKQVSSETEVEDFIDRLLNGERQLSNQLLARLFILKEHNNRFHLLIYATHFIADGRSKIHLICCMLEELASPSNDESWDLEERLALAVPLEDLTPIMKLSPARQRWCRAIAGVIYASRSQRLGGHTLPRTYTKLTKFTPPVSARIRHILSLEDTSNILKNCKNLGLTFGSILPIIGQVALSRLLCRRYLQGHISQEEWDFRKKEPMTIVGPFDTRPFLDKEWYEQGGGSNVCTSVGHYTCKLPFMPLGTAFRLAPGDKAPSYRELLSFGRFVLRSKSIQKQVVKLFKHPLFLDIALAGQPKKMDCARKIALTWEEAHSQARGSIVKPLSVIEESRGGLVLSHGGSNFGNINNIMPFTFDGSHARLEIRNIFSLLRLIPDQLYLGSGVGHKRLGLSILWDKNVYDETIVEEWLGEVVEATKHYLVGEVCSKL